jgi:hypothetical protein
MIPLLLGWIDMLFIKKWHKEITGEGTIDTNSRETKLAPVKADTAAVKEKVSMSSEEPKKKSIFASPEPKEKSRVKDHSKKEEGFVKSLGKLKYFYDQDAVILDKYKHLQTPEEIKQNVDDIQFSEKNIRRNQGLQIRVSYSTGGQEFVRDSIKYANKKGFDSKEIPLKEYWTTFSNLNDKQKKWYFYWRTQVLEGKYPEVDLSYIILFMYELMNYSFNKNAAFNVSMMVRLHDEYKDRIPKLTNYSKTWIADMLYELEENLLAKEWDEGRMYTPQLYYTLQEKGNDLSKISITTWKAFFRVQETKFMQLHKNKVYKTFKQAIVLLSEEYKERGTSFMEDWFKEKEERQIRSLFRSAVMGRDVDQIHVYVKHVVVKPDLEKELTALFKLSENVTRKMNGENREIKVDETLLPENFKEKVFDYLMNKQNKRFKVVQKTSEVEETEAIPSPPVSEVAAPKENVSDEKSALKFDKERIEKLIKDSNELTEAVNARDEGSGSKAEMETEYKEDSKQEKTPDKADKTSPFASMSMDDMFEGEVDEESLNDLIRELSEIEKGFLGKFRDGELEKEKAGAYLKENGYMMGMFLSELNEKAVEYLGDNLIEEQDDEIVIYEEYEEVLSKVKELVV